MRIIVAIAAVIVGAVASPVERQLPGGSHCDSFCTQQFQPVCGSDGKTYPNMCYLSNAACHYKEIGFMVLTVEHQGACADRRSLKDTALHLQGAVASPVERQLPGGSHCDSFCTEQYQPVCGSDGKTYSNMCFLTNAACHYKEIGFMVLTVEHQGACTGSMKDTARPYYYTSTPYPGWYSSHYYYTSTPRPWLARSCDMLCDEERNPLCASDYKIYNNVCLYNRAQCEAYNRNETLYVISMGEICPTPVTPDCSKYEIDSTDIAVEGGVINFRCHHDGHYVCGSDRMTYSNECYLCQHMKHYNQTLNIAYTGRCTTHHIVLPDTNTGNPVIG